jgi:hypothetical protein
VKYQRLNPQDEVEFEIVLAKYKTQPKRKFSMDEKYFAIVLSKEQGVFQIANIPFYCNFLSYGDIIYAEFDKAENCFVFCLVIESSGFKSIPLIIKHRDLTIPKIIKTLCLITDVNFEAISDVEFSISVEKRHLKFNSLEKKINELEQEGILIRLDN